MRKIDFIFFDAGGGHRASANAVAEVIARDHRPWNVRRVNLQEVLDPIDIARQLFGLRLEDVYNLVLRKGWTLGSPVALRVLSALIRSRFGATVRLLEQFWASDPPEMAVSFVPHFNRAMCQALRTVGTPSGGEPAFVTVLTDLADTPPHFWIERQRQHLICGTERAVEQARGMGYAEDSIHRTSGMILHPRFYEPVVTGRESERRRLGLDPLRPTALILFGGMGSPVMMRIARELNREELGVQCLFICGRNAALAAELRALPWKIPVHVEEFTSNIPAFMHLADCFIGKPGPGSLSEALHMRLPVIVESNSWTLPQERYNADWIRETNVGIVLESHREIAGAVRQMLDPENLRRFREHAAALRNRAVFEVPEILETILNAAGSSTSPRMQVPSAEAGNH